MPETSSRPFRLVAPSMARSPRKSPSGAGERASRAALWTIARTLAAAGALGASACGPAGQTTAGGEAGCAASLGPAGLCRADRSPDARAPAPRDFEGSARARLGRRAVGEKDLAVMLALDDDALLQPSRALPGGDVLLPPEWYAAVAAGFGPTDVADAFVGESRASDWRLVSFRVAPCSPLGLMPQADIDHLCWPEVRLVWQPIVRNGSCSISAGHPRGRWGRTIRASTRSHR